MKSKTNIQIFKIAINKYNKKYHLNILYILLIYILFYIKNLKKLLYMIYN